MTSSRIDFLRNKPLSTCDRALAKVPFTTTSLTMITLRAHATTPHWTELGQDHPASSRERSRQDLGLRIGLGVSRFKA